ncbi:MAG: S8 family serine peptidase [Flexilinea sp.]
MKKNHYRFFWWIIPVAAVLVFAAFPVLADDPVVPESFSATPLTAEQTAEIEAIIAEKEAERYPIEISVFSGLSDEDLQKIKDPAFLEYVENARALLSSGEKAATVTSRDFKVFFTYDPAGKDDLRMLAETLEITEIYFYKYADLISVSAGAEQLAGLLQGNSVIISVETDELSSSSAMTLGTATEAITNVSVMHNAGYDGEGAYVAIIDTGLNPANPEFGGRVAYEHCWSTELDYSADMISYASCADTASPAIATTESGSAYTYWGATYPELFSHGSHVTGIAAGNGGIAPQANIVALQVFSLFSINDSGTWYRDALSYDSDQMRALEYLIDLRGTGVNIVAANMSLGGGTYSDYCDTDPRKLYIDLLASMGTVTVIASGNNGWDGYTNAPGCISSAYTVGALNYVNNEPEIVYFSNHGLPVDLLAPGVSIHSTLLDGSFANWSGTSMATPMVTGAIALVSGKVPETTGINVQSFLQNVSRVSATRNVYTRKILNFSDVPAALDALNNPWWRVGDPDQPINGFPAAPEDIEWLFPEAGWQYE